MGRVHGTFRVKVNYTLSLEEMIQAGQYDWVNPRILRELGPFTGARHQEYELLNYRIDRMMTTREILQALEKDGLVAATLPLMLAHTARYGGDGSFVSLGTLCTQGHESVPCVIGNAVTRRLSLEWCGFRWREHFSFLAVSARK